MKQKICTLTLLASLIICAGAVETNVETNLGLSLAGLAGMALSILAGGLDKENE